MFNSSAVLGMPGVQTASSKSDAFRIIMITFWTANTT